MPFERRCVVPGLAAVAGLEAGVGFGDVGRPGLVRDGVPVPVVAGGLGVDDGCCRAVVSSGAVFFGTVFGGAGVFGAVLGGAVVFGAVLGGAVVVGAVDRDCGAGVGSPATVAGGAGVWAAATVGACVDWPACRAAASKAVCAGVPTLTLAMSMICLKWGKRMSMPARLGWVCVRRCGRDCWLG